jgi:hypothetical protein
MFINKGIRERTVCVINILQQRVTYLLYIYKLRDITPYDVSQLLKLLFFPKWTDPVSIFEADHNGF